jgi:multicomponent Na+:H+ antiporter subunit C
LLFGIGFAALVTRSHLLWRIIALNVMASGVSLLLLTLPRPRRRRADPVPQAMVLTGIVVMVAATALALALAVRLAAMTAADDGDCDGIGTERMNDALLPLMVLVPLAGACVAVVSGRAAAAAAMPQP